MSTAGARDREGLVMGVLGVVIFGLTLPALRAAVAELDPLFVVFGRALAAAACAVLVLVVTRPRLPAGGQWIRLLLIGLLAVIGFPLGAAIGMRYDAASHGAVILAVLPLGTALAGMLFAGERPSPVFWLWSVAGTLAVAAFAFTNVESAGSHVSDWNAGNVWLAFAVACASIGYAIGGALSRDLGGWQVICWALVLTAPIVLVLGLAMPIPVRWQASAGAWTGFGYNALFSQFIGFFFWYRGLALGGVARVGQVQLLQPFVTIAGAAVLLGEAIRPRELGFALLVVAIVAAGSRARIGRRP